MRRPSISETAKKFMAENAAELECLREMIRNFERVNENEYNEKNADFTKRAISACGRDAGAFLLCYLKNGKKVTSL